MKEMLQAGVLILLAMVWVQVPSQAPAPVAPPETAMGPEQPLPFSHKNHAGTLGLPCEACHVLSRSGQTLSIPQAATCMQCHQTLATEKPSIQKLAAYAKAGAPIPWLRIYELPSFVTFSHKTHLDHGNTCQECHGQVATRDRLFQETELSMAACIKCHTAKGANTGCDTCHSLEQ